MRGMRLSHKLSVIAPDDLTPLKIKPSLIFAADNHLCRVSDDSLVRCIHFPQPCFQFCFYGEVLMPQYSRVSERLPEVRKFDFYKMKPIH
jgi:hypothetical protein